MKGWQGEVDVVVLEMALQRSGAVLWVAGIHAHAHTHTQVLSKQMSKLNELCEKCAKWPATQVLTPFATRIYSKAEQYSQHTLIESSDLDVHYVTYIGGMARSE